MTVLIVNPDTAACGQSMPAHVEEAFRRLVTARTGIMLYDYQMQHLRDTVIQACERFGYDGEADYLRSLEEKAGFSPELEFLLAGVTVGESYFFRDSGQMALLRDSLLPEMIARKRLANDCSLRIWSAGCSNGQEIYSIVMLLHEILPDFDDWALHFLATDINTSVLANATRACYGEWSLRVTPPAVVQRYFTQAGDEYVLSENIRKRARFAYLNLSEDAFPSMLTETSALDLILCRNVFIYIEPEASRTIMNRFAACLVFDGVLLLGASDHVVWPEEMLAREQIADASYLRRRPAPQISEPVVDGSPVPATQSAVVTDAMVDAALKTLGTRSWAAKNGAVKTDLQDGLSRVIKLVCEERWRDALALIEEVIAKSGVSAEIWQLKAKALANLGNLEDALRACQQSLSMEPTDKHTYLILGIVLIEQNQPQDAEIALRKAIYLDHAFLEAHHRLGLLQLRLGRRDAGLKSLSNALALAEHGDPYRGIHNAPGVNYGRFAEALRDEIRWYTDTAPGELLI
jgi:chemotaxis protein methyltransferase CheR